MSDETKAVVTVSEMARMCSLSRARFYQLQKAGVFPPPQKDAETGRPFYPEEIQKVCLEVRRRNFGVNGKAVLFYAQRNLGAPVTKGPKTNASPKPPPHADLLDALAGLGLVSVTAAQVGQAVKEIFPQGIANQDQGEVVRAVFLHLRRKNPGDNVGQ